MDTYNEKSCNALEKPYYQPIEAALRWCGLASHESEILKATGDSVLPPVSAFPRWPCLRANAEKILEAMECGELTISRDGRPVPAGDHVARHRRTVRHADLKAWMSKHYPDQKPAFLFDETERSTHNAINADSFRALQADRDAARARLEKAEEWAKKTIAEMNALRSELDAFKAQAEQQSAPNARAETTYLNIIGAMLELMKSPRPGRDSDAAVIAEIEDNYREKPGISARTLQEKFAAAKRSLNAS